MAHERDSLHDIRITVQSATARMYAAAAAGNAEDGMRIANSVLPQIQVLSPLDSVRQCFAQALQSLVRIDASAHADAAGSVSAPARKAPSATHATKRRAPRSRIPVQPEQCAAAPDDTMAADFLLGLLEVKLARVCHGAPLKSRRRIRESSLISLSQYPDVRRACERIASVLQQPQSPDRTCAIRTIINAVSLRDNPELSTLITETLDQMLVDRGILPEPPDDDVF